VQRGTCKVRTPNPVNVRNNPTNCARPQPVNDEPRNQQSTHYHRCKPLLAGWTVGANGQITRDQQQGMTTATTTNTTPEQPSTCPPAASNCSQVGSRVLKATTGTCK
jgi:hypothetical protein